MIFKRIRPAAITWRRDGLQAFGVMGIVGTLIASGSRGGLELSYPWPLVLGFVASIEVAALRPNWAAEALEAFP